MISEFGGAATSAMHGGILDLPTQRTNTNMPVQSKISTKDGSDASWPDAADGLRSPDKTFGFTSPQEKIKSKERQSQWIDKNRRRARFVTVPPYTLY